MPEETPIIEEPVVEEPAANSAPAEPEEVRTDEEVRSSINAAFDSVGLINRIVAGEQMQEETLQERVDCVERNVGHLNIMLNKTWFANGLTSTETSDINAAIAAGEQYQTDNPV